MDEALESKKDYLLPASILIAAVLISGSIVYMVGSRDKVPGGEDRSKELAAIGQSVSILKRDVILGEPNAPVSIVEYGDYQCPFCGKFFKETEPLIREDYIKTGKVKMAYRNFAFLGPESFDAAEAAECAKDQKQFWGYHDLIFEREDADGRENNGNLNRNLFLELAGELKLDTKVFAECFDTEKYALSVKKESDEARTVRVDSTPTNFINGEIVKGALPYSSFKAIIEGFLTGKNS